MRYDDVGWEVGRSRWAQALCTAVVELYTGDRQVWNQAAVGACGGPPLAPRSLVFFRPPHYAGSYAGRWG